MFLKDEDLFMIGYARVSREDQNLAMQKQALLKFGIDEKQIFVEKCSGISAKRPQFNLALKRARRGDAFVVWKLDRVGRSMKHLCDFVLDLEKRGIAFISLTEHIETQSSSGKMMFHITAAFAQFERDMISERTKAGIAEAKRNGSWKSKPVSFTKKEWIKALKAAEKDENTAKKIAAISGLKLNIVYKHIKALRAGAEWKWGDNTMENQKKKGKKK